MEDASRTTSRTARRPRPIVEWVGEGLVVVDFRPPSRVSRVRRIQHRLAVVVSGLAIGGGLGVAALALHHILTGG